MNPCVASDEHSETDRIVPKAAWTVPTLRRTGVQRSEADHGENHFDGPGFS
jgi:hypothetical protein